MEKSHIEYGVSGWKDAEGSSIRTDGCFLAFCRRGMAAVSVAFKPRAIRKGDLAVIFPDTPFIVNNVSALFSVQYLEIAPELLDEAVFTLSSRFFDLVYDNPIFRTTPGQRELLQAWERQFLWIAQCQVQKPAYTMLRNHLQNFFVGLENIAIAAVSSPPLIQPASPARQLFNGFCRLVVQHCHARHDVRFYADRLCITPYYLSKVTSRTMGVSPKELIDRQIVTEMKRLLATTDIPVKELAAQFHFDTVSYMARFFRRHTGCTPEEFRKQ